MKKIITKSILLLSVVILINLLMGWIRLKAGDDIPYTMNLRDEFITANQYKAFKDTTMYMKARTDMGHDSVNLPNGNLRVLDHFGFSNVAENNAPDLLYIGDSFFDDQLLNSSDGLQSLTNKKLGKNCSYNIGAHGCSGFNVYNELSAQYFTQKPKIIFFETVERALYAHIIDAFEQLEQHKFKTVQHHYYGMDLLLGANFSNLKQSKLWHKETSVNFGTPRMLDGNKIWFLRNRLSSFADLSGVLEKMAKMQQILKLKNIRLVYIIAPDKESLYPQLFGTSGIVLLQELMRDLNIEFIDIHSALLQDPAKYYYASDTHWNGNAVDLLTTMTTDYYRNTIE